MPQGGISLKHSVLMRYGTWVTVKHFVLLDKLGKVKLMKNTVSKEKLVYNRYSG